MDEKQQSEIVVIGAGVIGASIALELRRRGRQVCLVDRGDFGAEATGAAAGIIGAHSETESEVSAELGVRSAGLYRELVTEVEEETGVDVDYHQHGTLFLAYGADETRRLRDRAKRCARLGGSFEEVDADRLRRLEPRLKAPSPGTAILFPSEGRVDGRRLTHALVERLAQLGGSARRGCEVLRVSRAGNRVVGVETTGGGIVCDTVVDASGAWFGALSGGRCAAVAPQRGQMLHLRGSRTLFRRTVYTESGYLVPRGPRGVLVGSTRELVGFEKGVTAGGLLGLLSRGFSLSESLRSASVEGWWSGLRPASDDGLPLVGPWPDVRGYLVATGHGRNGVLLAPVTAHLVADLMDGREVPLAQVLRPERFDLN